MFFALKTFNLSTFFGAVKQTNFLDFTVSAFDIAVFFLLGIIIYYQFKENGLRRSWLLWLFLATTIFGLFQIHNWQHGFEVVWVWKLLIISARLCLVIGSSHLVYISKNLSPGWKWFYVSSLFLALFFDKFLLYNPQPPVFVGLVGFLLILTTLQKGKNLHNFLPQTIQVTLFIYIFLCLFTQIWQIITSTSFGINWLGESVLSLDTLGVAREKIGNIIFLRGYGLAEHASSMGFVGLMGVLLFQIPVVSLLPTPLSSASAVHTATAPRVGASPYSWRVEIFNTLSELPSVGMWLSVFVALLSLSRSVLTIVFVFGTLLLWKRFGFIFKQLSIFIKLFISLILAASLFLLIWQNIFLREQSNSMRFEELKTYSEAFTKMTPTQQLLGIGIGQYPYFLRTNFPDEQIKYWQAYPVHNTFLSISIDLGIVPTGLLIAYILKYCLTRKKKFSTTEH